ncbi:MAG: hypothetical protein V1722_04740 [Candidatus Micrarchaeota archaeon]
MTNKRPHVILVLGPHVQGVEKCLPAVVAAEKPVALLHESSDSRSKQLEILQKLRGASGIDVKFPKSFLLGMHTFAREHNLEHDLVGPADEVEAEADDVVFNTSSIEMSSTIKAAQQGNVDEMVKFGHRVFSALSFLERSASSRYTSFLTEKARQAKGPVLAYIGTAHTALVKDLVHRGVKVTLYAVQRGDPVSPAVPSSGHLISKPVVLREVLRQLLTVYLEDRYKFTNQHNAFAEQYLPELTKLRQVPLSRFEHFIASSKDSTPVGFRVRFVDFLKQNGVHLPSNDEVAERLRKEFVPGVRKVKVFEPK